MTNRHIVFIAVVVTFLITSLAWVGIGFAGYHLYTSPPPNFEVVVDTPEVVTLGEEFSLTLSVKGSNGGELNLESIDLYRDLLDGFEILSVHPKPDAAAGYEDFLTYYCGTASGSSSEFTLTIMLKAKEVGDWGGEIDCCTPMMNYLTNYTEISVVEP